MPDKQEILKQLETERLLLKPISREFKQEIYKHFSDQAVTRYMDIDVLKSVQEAEEIIDFYVEKEDQEKCYRWVIIRKEDNAFLGTCGFNSWEKCRANRVEIGYDLSKKYWRQGYMQEAVKRLINHGFEILNLHRIEAKVTKGNEPSCRLLEKLNFTEEGFLRDYNYWKGEYISEYMYSLLEDEYRKNL
ncbi:MAG TPA: GNAT family protein [Halanaerobiales bacterium]|nr:GNAT family protein [Halanaerobiales bacterium]